VSYCESCDREVVVARDLDERDELVPICPHCDTVLDAVKSERGGFALRSLGYEVEGEGPKSRGCGSGGSCSGCSH
jgi:hypothetical protein